MKEILSFPGLGLEMELGRVAFEVGNYAIYWYGITFALAFLVGIGYFQLRAKKMGIHPYDGLDVVLWAIVGGMIGARAYFVAFQWDMYKDNLIKIFAVREGGLAIYGGVIGAILAGLIACKVKKLPAAPMLDVGLTGLLLAQGVGRWGNFFNMEAFGCNTSLPWGMTSNTISNYLFGMADSLAAQGIVVDPTVPVHPTFFYEFIWNIIGFAVLAFLLTPRRKYDGQVALGYMAWYGLGRYFIEGLRTDSLMWGQYRVSQMLALGLCVVSVVLLVVFYIRGKKDPVPAMYTLYADRPESLERVAMVDKQLADEKAASKAKHAKKNEAANETQDVTAEAQDEVAETLDEASEAQGEAAETLDVTTETLDVTAPTPEQDEKEK